MWESVRSGEKKYISPYKVLADYSIDSLQDYEPGLFRTMLEPLMETIDNNNIYYKVLMQLYSELSYFEKVPSKLVPLDSLLNEFI
jgi:uridine kinase